MSRHALLAVALAVQFSVPLLAQVPRVTTRAGAMRVSLPRAVLVREDVRRQLTNGLTTVFTIGVTTSAGARRARVEIRYELWEEKYLAEVYEATGRRSADLADFERLLKWWEQLTLLFAGNAGVGEADVTIDVLPFSAREAADVQKWLAGSMTKAQAASGLAKNLPDPAQESSNFFDILIGTSMKRKPIVEMHWKVPIVAEGR